MKCLVCGKPLTGGVDTYGDVGSEVCFEDFVFPPDYDFGDPANPNELYDYTEGDIGQDGEI